MGITNQATRTRIDEIGDGLFRISIPLRDVPGGFSFNQYLLLDEEPLLYHTGPRRMLALVREAIATVLPVERLRYIGCSHFENDECGSMNELLAIAPRAQPLCGRVNAMINGEFFERPPRVIGDSEIIFLGQRRVRWFDTPHLPHAWECGHLFEETTHTLLCGDLFTQGGAENKPVRTDDILGPSEAFRRQMDYFAHTAEAREHLTRLAASGPTTLACMHGSAWQGDGARLLLELADSIEQPTLPPPKERPARAGREAH